MRKIALLTVPMLMLGVVSLSADDRSFKTDSIAVEPKVEIGAHSHLTFGIDLETNATGFTNSTDVDLKVTMIPKATNASGMDMGDIYGWIELKDYKWEVTSADGSGKTSTPSITTKLFVGPFSITTYNKPTIEIDYVDPKDDDDPDETDVDHKYTGSGGLTLGYKLDPIDLSLAILSRNDWTEDGATDKDITACHDHKPDGSTVACKNADNPDRNDENAYAFMGTVGVDLGDAADLELRASYGHEYPVKPIGIGAKATFDLDDTIHPHVAFDGEIHEGDANIPWDVGSGIKWDLSADDKSYFETNLFMHIPQTGNSQLNISATLKEGDGDAGGLEGLGATLTVGLSDLTNPKPNASTWNAQVAGHYSVSGIKPFFDVSFSNKQDAKTSLKAGLELSMVDHLVTTLQYKSDDITGTEPDKGEVTAELKISY